MNQAVNGNREKRVAGHGIKTSSMGVRVTLAKKKIEKELRAQLNGEDEGDVRLRLAIVFQALDDLHLSGIGEAGRAMAVVYLYSSEIRELEEMNVETGWVQRILNDLHILNVADPAPYIEASGVIQQESQKAYSRGQGSGLMKFIPVCEGVQVRAVNECADKAHRAA